MAVEVEEITWVGAESLRALLVPLDSLTPHPQNPRHGSVRAIVESLRRFGQVRPILVDSGQIVAGNHTYLAARELGWSHIAAIEHRFGDEAEVRAYLLADNRTHDLGDGYDRALLVEHLQMLAELDALAGTGYSTDDLDDELAALRKLSEAPLPSVIDGDGKREHRDPQQKELVLIFSAAQLDQVERWMQIVAHEKGTPGTSETVYAALEVAARHLNGQS